VKASNMSNTVVCTRVGAMGLTRASADGLSLVAARGLALVGAAATRYDLVATGANGLSLVGQAVWPLSARSNHEPHRGERRQSRQPQVVATRPANGSNPSTTNSAVTGCALNGVKPKRRRRP
jgi:hypothetical protein